MLFAGVAFCVATVVRLLSLLLRKNSRRSYFLSWLVSVVIWSVVAYIVVGDLVLWLYGGEDEEAITYMESVPETLSDEQWLEQVENMTRTIESLSVVKGKVGFFYGEKANDNKVQVSVWCCWAAARGTFKQVIANCDDKGEKPTHLEARCSPRRPLAVPRLAAPSPTNPPTH